MSSTRQSPSTDSESQSDKSEPSNVKFTNPEETANPHVHHKSQQTTMLETFI
jgi:hypothetical protein